MLSADQPKRPVNIHSAYHAHVYFDSNTVEFAADLCAETGKLFKVKVGTVHRKPVGPHPNWSCQITFGSALFDSIVTHLDKNRKNLSILIHALTGNDYKDHTDYAYWLGSSVELDLSALGTS